MTSFKFVSFVALRGAWFSVLVVLAVLLLEEANIYINHHVPNLLIGAFALSLLIQMGVFKRDEA